MLAAAMLLQGVTQGALVPFLYEFSAELTYPANEGTSAGALTFIWNMSTLLVLAVSPHLSTDVPSTIFACTLVLCAVLVGLSKERYLRSEAEDNIMKQGSDKAVAPEHLVYTVVAHGVVGDAPNEDGLEPLIQPNSDKQA